MGISDEIERLLGAGERGTTELMGLVYGELRRMAEGLLRKEQHGHTLQPTALVHEAFLRLVDAEKVGRAGRLQFLEAAAVTMRRVLVDHARRRDAQKRGGGAWERVTLDGLVLDGDTPTDNDVDLVELDAALARLEQLDAQQARVVELRFFGGLTSQEVAEHLEISRSTVTRELTMARAWLRRELDRPSAD